MEKKREKESEIKKSKPGLNNNPKLNIHFDKSHNWKSSGNDKIEMMEGNRT